MAKSSDQIAAESNHCKRPLERLIVTTTQTPSRRPSGMDGFRTVFSRAVLFIIAAILNVTSHKRPQRPFYLTILAERETGNETTSNLETVEHIRVEDRRGKVESHPA
ncbi:MAG: hypothetical protein HGA79_00390 [Anaerolineales bacterium]|nr:hypothetical protein [Anaerolineales bacterium]